MPVPPPNSLGEIGRRRFLRLAAGGVVAAASLAAFFRTRGYHLTAEARAKLVVLAPWQFIVVEHAARRIAAPDRPDTGIPTPDELDVAGFVDTYVSRLPAAKRRDLGRLFAYLEHVAPLRLALASRFSKLAPPDQDRVLASLESSEEPLLRGGFEGLKALVFMGYYRHPRTWKLLDYAGPWVDRPETGWW